MSEPRYEHDCDLCKFLGHYGTDDVWAHYRSSGIIEIILRRSDDGPDYTVISRWIYHDQLPR